jgi:large subunit ribosomal protein L23
MALFGKKDAKATDATVATEEKVVVPQKLTAGRDIASIIVRPRITEKAAIDRNVYTFEIKKSATKFDVRDAIQALYDVTPVKVHIVNKTPRHYVSRARGRDMMEKGFKKAYVYLKEGDRIDLV